MKKFFIGIGILGLLAVIGLGIGIGTGYVSLGKNKCVDENKTDKIEKTEPTISYQDLRIMESISEYVFEVDKDNLKVSDITGEQKIHLVTTIGWLLEGKEGGSAPNLFTGEELTNIFHKYFGKNEKLEFVDIKCKMNHNSEEENVIYRYDEGQGKYVYNDLHPGHGGGGNAYQSYMDLEKIEITNNGYQYQTKVVFYDGGSTGDTGRYLFDNAYKTYQDATAHQNAVSSIKGNTKYVTENYMGETVFQEEKLFQDIRNQLNTYTFEFEKEGDHLIFKGYSKK